MPPGAPRGLRRRRLGGADQKRERAGGFIRPGPDEPGVDKPATSETGTEEPSPDVPRPDKPARRSATTTKILVRVDLEALLRGYPAQGEVCEVVGFGPVATSAITDMIRNR